MVDVLVEGQPGSQRQVLAAVAAAGGTVTAELDVLDGVAAAVPASAQALLRSSAGVLDVTADSTLVPLDARWGDDTTREGRRASLGNGIWTSRLDRGSLYTVAEQVGADDVWRVADPADPSRTLTGAGVGVALVDTGVAAVEGLLAPGTVVHGPDLSFDSQQDSTRSTDGMGHGTHMAGIIAGRDSGVRPGKEHDARQFTGVAPGARVVDVKVGAGDGGVDVSQVVAAIDWVVANRQRHGIRVINLSYGTPSTQPYRLDPLAHAVESAWHAGVVVVVAAGNDGESGPRPLTMPAADPYVIAGRVLRPPRQHRSRRLAGRCLDQRGTEARRPDVLAPGKSVVSLRVPGSWVDQQHPEGLVPGDRAGRFFRGTGTSQSAAVVSGAVALLLQADPTLTPDQVKGLLRSTAHRLPGDASPVQGAGLVDVAAAVHRGPRRLGARLDADRPALDRARLARGLACRHLGRRPDGRLAPRGRAGHLRPGLGPRRCGPRCRPPGAPGPAARSTGGPGAGPAGRGDTGRPRSGRAARGPGVPGPGGPGRARPSRTAAGPAGRGRAVPGRVAPGPGAPGPRPGGKVAPGPRRSGRAAPGPVGPGQRTGGPEPISPSVRSRHAV
jgi:serine protease AprX